jgi:hypothetical protein
LADHLRIVAKPVSFPNEPAISPEAKDIIRQFCTVDRSKRLGNISGGAQRVKDHPFFHGVIWEDVYYRKYRGPIIPPIRYPGDAQCFDHYPDEKEGRASYTDDLVGCGGEILFLFSTVSRFFQRQCLIFTEQLLTPQQKRKWDDHFKDF